MNLYYSSSLSREGLLKEAFAREKISLPGSLPRTPNGKPCLAGVEFSLTHTEDFIAVAIGQEPVGLDAERRTPRRTEALSRRLTEREKKEDFFELWTAKEAFVKFCGGTLASLLPRLEYAERTLYLDGAPVPLFLSRFELGGCTLCLCTEMKTEISLIEL